MLQTSASDFKAGRPKWWQWPTILSLDAPLVAVAWQSLFARVVSVPWRKDHALLLGSTVWLSYSADRWIEGWRLPQAGIRTQRHHFAVVWRWEMATVWLSVLAASIFIAGSTFSAREWSFSLALLLPTLLYLVSHQFLHRRSRWRVPKEICVATILSCGSALYPAALAPGHWKGLLGPSLIFFGLILSNCLLIARWEQDVDLAHGNALTARRKRFNVRATAAALLAELVLSGAWMAGGNSSAIAVGSSGILSTVLLLVLISIHSKLGRERSRVLVDVALMTPLLFLFFL